MLLGLHAMLPVHHEYSKYDCKNLRAIVIKQDYVNRLARIRQGDDPLLISSPSLMTSIQHEFPRGKNHSRRHGDLQIMEDDLLSLYLNELPIALFSKYFVNSSARA